MLGKESRIINYSPTPENLLFLDKSNVIEKFNAECHDRVIEDADVIMLIDFNHISRTSDMQDSIKKSDAVTICIDHHEAGEPFADYLLIDTEYSSAGEIVYELLECVKDLEWNIDLALPIYSAIMTDTGSFRFERTSARTHKIAARLIELGVDPRSTHRIIYDQMSVNQLKLLGRALASMERDESGSICYMNLTRTDLDATGTSEEDIEGFVNYTMKVKGVKIGLLFYKLEDGFKVSFRSIGDIPVNKLAGDFGGGGHFNAAGTRIKGEKMEDYIMKVVSRAAEYLK
jgi:phosphoesterase RecJ-like protein